MPRHAVPHAPPALLSEAPAALVGQGFEGYQITHTLSLFSNMGAGFLEARDSDLTELLEAAPRPVHELVTKAAVG